MMNEEETDETSLLSNPLTILPPAQHDIANEGSDMTRDIHVALFKDKTRPAASSMPESEFVMYQDIGKASDLAKPGGFRRDHVIATKYEEGESPPSHVYTPFLETVRPSRFQTATRDIEDAYDDFVYANFEVGLSMEDFQDTQRTPLIRRAVRQQQEVPKSPEEKGASIKKTVFTILKSFIGSGILFLPKGFQNGGMLFSIVVLFVSAILSVVSMLRLAACSNAVHASTSGVSYGMLGERAFGKLGKIAVNVSLVLSQLGFCCTYLIFIERNIRDIIMHLTDCKVIPGPWLMILLQIPVYTPLSWVRKIKYFAVTNLFADFLVLFGLIYIMVYSVSHLSSSTTPPEWHNFNEKHYGLFLGTAVYVFEGIGLVLPIYDSMDKSVRRHFPSVLVNSIGFLLCFFCLFAGIVYASFGNDTQTVVTLNLPNNGIQTGTISVQFAYCIALVFTYPLMMYPALMILESYCVPSAGRVKGAYRWTKNIFRFLLVCTTATVSILCMDELDNFVALIGGFCSVPLAFIYPGLFHNRIVQDRNAIHINQLIIAIGICTMIFATYQSLSTWAPPKNDSDYCTNLTLPVL